MGVVAISVDEPADSVSLAGKLGISFPLLSDPGLKTTLAFGVAMDGEEIAVPATFIVTKDKRIVFVKVGESVTDRPSVSDLLEQIDALK